MLDGQLKILLGSESYYLAIMGPCQRVGWFGGKFDGASQINCGSLIDEQVRTFVYPSYGFYNTRQRRPVNVE